MTLTVGSLFSGIGGIDLGLERAGMTVKWQCELDPYCRRVLAKHWPDVPCFEDITTTDWSTVERVDVVAGGFPCQPVSRAGRKLAQGDERWLWPYFAQVLRRVRPRFVLVENVPGLLVRGMGDVLGDLAALGFDAEWESIPAAAVGALHIRDRIWIVAYAGGERRDGGQGVEGARWEAAVGSEAGGHAGDSGSSSVADADSERRPERRGAGATTAALAGTEHGGEVVDAGGGRHWAQDGPVFTRRDAPVDAGGWLVEPDVGRSLDGFSSWLDRSGRLNEPHMLILAYANAEKVGPAEVVRGLRDGVGEEDDWWAAGGPGCLPAAAVLLAFLRQLSASVGKEGHLPLASTASPENGLRGLRVDKGAPRPPLRREPQEQRRGQPPDPLHSLSQLLARSAEQAWAAYRRSDAGAVGWGWEDGIARVASGVPHGVDRKRALGNAVVPQFVEYLGRRILDVAA